jgi:hypothetical protein
VEFVGTGLPALAVLGIPPLSAAAETISIDAAASGRAFSPTPTVTPRPPVWERR